MMGYSETIRHLRTSMRPKMTQNELAKLLYTSQRKISRIENGEAEPSVKDIILICKYFNVSADYLLGLEDHISEPKEN